MSLLGKYIPGHIGSPLGLSLRLLTDKKPAARSALAYAALGIACVPVDLLLARRENRLYEQAPDPRQPILLLCGAPRSGTTLIAEYLVHALHLCHPNNLASLFPRSPLTANRLFGRLLARQPAEFEAFYGKTRGLAGTNDGLFIWDRWLGADRSRNPGMLPAPDQRDMRRFFGALQQFGNKPVINKVNRLNTCAALVADALPTSTIVYVHRQRVSLAQSLYIARQKIVGDLSQPYGVAHPDRAIDDPVEDVCRQVEFYEQQLVQQRDAISSSRFIQVGYEEFCRRPADIVNDVVHRVGNVRRRSGVSLPNKFAVSDTCRIDRTVFDQFVKRLRR